MSNFSAPAMRPTLTLIAFMIGNTLASGQATCGFIDAARCTSALPERAIEEANIKARSLQLDDSLRILGKEYQRFILNCLPHGKQDSLVIATANDGIKSRERTFIDFMDHSATVLIAIEKASLERLEAILTTHSRAYYEERGLSLLATRDPLLYGPDCPDHTDGFIEYLKRRRL